MVESNIYDLISKNHKIEKYIDDIWIFILIIVILFIFKIKSLLFQYFLIILIMFIFSPMYGLLYGNIFFYIYNYTTFNINDNFMYYSLISGILINFFFLIYLKIYSRKINIYITTPLIILFSISFNFYYLFYYYNFINKKKNDDDCYKIIDKYNIGGKKNENSSFTYKDIETICTEFNYYKKK